MRRSAWRRGPSSPPANEALRAASAQASLLIVGAERTRHHGHLGTVVRAMVEHAACPVAVVPGFADRP
ncbi:universal stress protein [Nonomuraea guangzhouensis]|uniref:Universal stress protein n=1 Tax=Nonomuraea guangzhouensis TaxID=1291555 RepID=A0ABW4GTM7_9ACTN|nr:universal stress protein [Nonomuraea guangzhouensis]